MGVKIPIIRAVECPEKNIVVKVTDCDEHCDYCVPPVSERDEYILCNFPVK